MASLRRSDRSGSRWLGRRAVHARLADELSDGLGGPCAFRPPLVELFGLELDLRLGRIVRADLIDVPPVARRLRVRDDDPVERMFLGSVAGESNPDHRVSSRCGARSGAWVIGTSLEAPAPAPS